MKAEVGEETIETNMNNNILLICDLFLQVPTYESLLFD